MTRNKRRKEGFPWSAFFRGMTRIIAPFDRAPRQRRFVKTGDFRDDREAIAQAWRNVGGYLWSAIAQFEDETGIRIERRG